MVGLVMNILGGSEKIIFGTDWPAAPADLSVKAVLNLQIPKELQDCRRAGAILLSPSRTVPICWASISQAC